MLENLQVDETTGETHNPEQLDQRTVAQATAIIRGLVLCHWLSKE